MMAAGREISWGEILGVSLLGGLIYLGARGRAHANAEAELADEAEEQSPAEVAMGELEEFEHTSNPDVALRIALDHLRERGDYYSRLRECMGEDAERRAWTTATRAPVRSDNPPSWVRDEATWERAKRQVRPYWHSYSDPWAVVTHVYEQMGGRT